MIGTATISSWLPEAASTHARGVDVVFYGIYAMATVALLLGVGLAVAYFRLYKRQDRDQLGGVSGNLNRYLLTAWVLGAVGLAWFAFTAGIPGFVAQAVAPYGAYRIDVTAHQGGWDFTYPNGHVADTLTVQVGRPVMLSLTSADVSHSLSIPALRVNQAILPGRTSEAWFAATTPGTYDVHSNIYSGEGFADMATAVVVLDAAGFASWLAEVEDIFAGRTLPEVGELLYTRLGCMACHTLTGDKLIGPSFKDLYGFEFTNLEGRAYTIDDAHVRESLLEPNVSVREGFQPVMTPFAGVVSDQEIEAITAWLKTLSSKGGTEEAEPAPTADAAPQTGDEEGPREQEEH